MIPPSSLIYKPLIERYLHKINPQEVLSNTIIEFQIQTQEEIPELHFEMKTTNDDEEKSTDVSALLKEFDKRIGEFNFS